MFMEDVNNNNNLNSKSSNVFLSPNQVNHSVSELNTNEAKVAFIIR